MGHKASTLKNQYLVPGFEEKYIAKGEIIGPKTASLSNNNKILGETMKPFYLSKRASLPQLGDRVKIKEWDGSQNWVQIVYLNENSDTVAVQYDDGIAQTLSLSALLSQIIDRSNPN